MSKKAYAILGDYYHDHDLAFNALKEAVKCQDIELYDASVEDMSEILLKKPDLIVLDKENRINPEDKEVKYWMDEGIEAQIEDYVASGGSWLAWHAGLSSYKQGGLYYAMLRGYFKYHPSVNKEVRYIPSGNALGDYVPEPFAFIDEHYFVECDTANTNVFLLSESDDGQSTAGWAHEYGQGRVCCLTPAHRVEGLTNPKMIDLLAQCVKWCVDIK